MIFPLGGVGFDWEARAPTPRRRPGTCLFLDELHRLHIRQLGHVHGVVRAVMWHANFLLSQDPTFGQVPERAELLLEARSELEGSSEHLSDMRAGILSEYLLTLALHPFSGRHRIGDARLADRLAFRRGGVGVHGEHAVGPLSRHDSLDAVPEAGEQVTAVEIVD